MKTSQRKRIEIIIGEAVLIFFAFLFLLPILWMFCTSLKSSGQIAEYKQLFPNPATVRSYIEGFAGGQFGLYIRNTVFIGVMCVIGTVSSCSLVAFGFAKFKAKGKNFLFMVLLATMMVPQTVTLIPSYMLYSKLGWVNTFIPLILPAFFATSAFNVFLLRQFFAGLPNELAEAGRIDGCSWFGSFMRIYIPNTKPALLVVTINQLVYVWNDYMAPLIYLGKPDKFTVALGLNMFKAQYGGAMDVGPLMAMACLTVAPLLVLYVCFQKYFVEGIATSGIKG